VRRFAEGVNPGQYRVQVILDIGGGHAKDLIASLSENGVALRIVLLLSGMYGAVNFDD